MKNDSLGATNYLEGKIFVWRRGRDSNPRSFRSAVFKTAAFGRSATPPRIESKYGLHQGDYKGIRDFEYYPGSMASTPPI